MITVRLRYAKWLTWLTKIGRSTRSILVSIIDLAWLFFIDIIIKDPAKLLKTFVPMIRSLTKKWDVNRSPLYQHIQTKEIDKDFGKKLQKIF